MRIINTPWARLLDKEQLELLISTSATVEYEVGETVIKQGFAASHIHYLEEGMVKLNVSDRGKSTTFKMVNRDNFIGLMCSFVNKRLDFSAVAVTPVTLYLMNRETLEHLIKSNGDFALYIVRLMSELTNSVVHNLITLSHKNVNGAVATLLLDLIELFGSQEYELPFTRSEFADSLGYSKESVINCLSDLNKDGVVEISGKKVKVLDLERLSTIARNG